MRGTRADLEASRGARPPQEIERRLSAAEQRWLLDQLTRHRSRPAAAADDAANPREHAAVIQSNDPSSATAVAPAPGPGLGGEAPPDAGPAPATFLGETETSGTLREPLRPRAAPLLPVTLPITTRRPDSRIATSDGPGYRAVFSCARIRDSDTTEE